MEQSLIILIGFIFLGMLLYFYIFQKSPEEKIEVYRAKSRKLIEDISRHIQLGLYDWKVEESDPLSGWIVAKRKPYRIDVTPSGRVFFYKNYPYSSDWKLKVVEEKLLRHIIREQYKKSKRTRDDDFFNEKLEYYSDE